MNNQPYPFPNLPEIAADGEILASIALELARVHACAQCHGTVPPLIDNIAQLAGEITRLRTSCRTRPGTHMARDPYRRQIHRARRAMRKGDNPFQVVILGPDEPLGLVVLAAISRRAWRNRTAFVPFGITLAAFAVAAFTIPVMAGTGYW